MPDKINEMFAYVITDDGLGKGDEGIPAIQLNEMAYPLVGADMERMVSLREAANSIAKTKGAVIELRKFTEMEVLEVIGA